MSNTALLLIDIQCDYFKNGRFALPDMERAAKNAGSLLTRFRERSLPIIHVRHENAAPDAPFFREGSDGASIHPDISPRDSEPVITKHQVNAFRETNLKGLLDRDAIDSLLIAGAMSNMCIDAATRAASDFGYHCSVAHDACAAMPLVLGETAVPAGHVHAAFMAALGLGYARVASCEELLREI
jgi:nicotinamidase-related amidase